MARMKQSTLAPGEHAATQTKSSKMKKIKTPGTKKTAAKRLARSAGINQGNRVALLENGLVSMEETPKQLVKIVQRNAKMSPLLRLPGEITNIIWAFALGGQYIPVAEPTSSLMYGYWLSQVCALPIAEDETHELCGFHLPKVCRRIYSETATLSYSLNTFEVCFEKGFEFAWANKLLPAQKDAVTSIALEPTIPGTRVTDASVGLTRTMFPNLKRIELTTLSLGVIVKLCKIADTTAPRTFAEWKKCTVNHIKAKEGDDVEVILHKGYLRGEGEEVRLNI
ncbi:Nn.00g058880.m01.CDS01 [Neocucurbitaria sp. VM-36]